MNDNISQIKETSTDKNMLTIFAAITVSFVLAIFVSIFSLTMLARENTKDIDTMLTYRIYDSISSSLNEPIVVARTMACNDLLADFLKNEDSLTEQEAIDIMKNYLGNVKRGLEYDSAFLVSESTHRYYTYEGLNKIVDPVNDDHDIWYSLFLEQNVPLDLDVDTDEVNQGLWTVFVNARIEDENGKLLGVCGVGVQMTNLQELFLTSEKEYDVKINLVDENGLVQVDTNDINIENARFDASILNTHDPEEFIYQTIDNNEFAVTKYVEYLDWYLVVSSTPTSISDEFINVILVNIVLFLFVMVMLIITIALILRRIKKERDEREKLLIVSERALASSDAKSSFLSNMSHEIRTPINAVLGMNEMILRESDDTNVLTYSESIKTAGHTLLGLINDILDFSKIEAGKMEIIPVEYEIPEMVNDLVNMIQTRANDKGLELKLDFNQDIPKVLFGDEVRIKQIITNILTNAVKYTEKGSVTFSIDYEKMVTEPEYVTLKVSVKDTGIGIKPEDMKKLFEEFERIEEQRNRNVEGTGLGMNITKTLLEMMGSSLHVDSVYGEGSVFSFDLKQKVIKWEPLGDYEAAYRASISSHARYKEKFTAPDAVVLVVDDTVTNLDVFKNLLKQTRVKVETTQTGTECLELTHNKKYDLIFLDHMMPDMDGIETLHEMHMQDDNPNIDTPAVCLTANAISGAREMYLEAGFTDYLTKPINPDELEDMLIQYLPEDKILSPSMESSGSNETASNESVSGEETDESKGSEEELPAWLKNCKELDTANGVYYCGGISGYLSVLTNYHSSIKDDADTIEDYYRSDDIANYKIKVHAIKSTSRAIGATALSEKARLLEEAGDAGDINYIRNNTDEMLKEYRSYIEILSPLDISKTDLPDIPEDILSDAYAAIAEFTETKDYDLTHMVTESVKEYKLSPNDEKCFAAIRTCLSRMDWDGIKEILKQNN